MKAVEIENVTFKYENKTAPILSGLSLSVEKGEFLAIVGRNASGKSTLARLINGLIAPLSGKIEVFGMDTATEENLFEIRKNVGIVFQNPDNQTVASIVEDDVAFGPENIGIECEEIGRRIDFALKATGTESYRTAMASKLSGGQKQRVAIAGVIAIKPQILILDEATSMLDPKGRTEVMDVVKKLNREDKMTVITITHYMEEAVECDNIAVLADGKIIKKATPEEIFTDDKLLKYARLEPPLAMKITNGLAERGINIGTALDVDGLKALIAKKICR